MTIGHCASNNAEFSPSLSPPLPPPPVIIERARETGTNDKGGKEQGIIKREWQVSGGDGIRGEEERFIKRGGGGSKVEGAVYIHIYIT